MKQEFIKPTLLSVPVRIVTSDYAVEERSAEWHFHEESEILWIQDGVKDICIDNNTYTLQKDDIIFINEYIPHKTYTYKGNRTFLLQMNSHQFSLNPVHSQKQERNFFIFRNGDAVHSCMRSIMQSISEENCRQQAFIEFFMTSYIYEILGIFYRNDILTSSKTGSLDGNFQRIAPVLEYMEKHYSENISLEDAVQLCPANKAYFCRMFKKVTGNSFVEQLYHIRINAAEKLLLRRDKSIAEIAYEVGFSSPSYFTKIFHAYKGYPPSFYKKLQKK